MTKHKAPVFLGEKLKQEKRFTEHWFCNDAFVVQHAWDGRFIARTRDTGRLRALCCFAYGSTPAEATGKLSRIVVREFRRIGAALGYEVE